MATPALNIPVTHVVLYSSGVAFYEHAGNVTGTGTTELRFQTAQINDVLKSLVLQDTAGGKIGTIIYPSHQPIDKALKSFQVDLAQNPPLPAILSQLRGAAVTVKVAAETTTGAILGLEKRHRAVDRAHFDIWVLNILSDGVIRSLPLDDITSLTLQDPRLQQELTRALSVVAEARDQDKKPVTIAFEGEGTRQVRIGYVVEAPLWKSSYRLVLPPEGADQPAHLQGWAIIENQTDNDWPGVTLTLVSGRPISFIQELYTPTYLPRPVVEPELFASIQPQVYGAGIPMAASAAVPEPASGGTLRARRSGLSPDALLCAAPLQDSGIDATASVTTAAQSGQLGELFQYTVHNVHLPRQRSAMIPIVTDAIHAERLSIYNQTVLAQHPLYGVKLTNTTGKHLLQGPVTVLEASAYAGDARIENLPPGQHRLLSYGIDLHITVNAANRASRATVQSGRIAKGVLEVSEKLLQVTRYDVANKSHAPKTLLIEHPLDPGAALVDAPAPDETTDSHYRLRYTLSPGESRQITVTTERTRTRRVALVSDAARELELLSTSTGIAPPVSAAIRNALQRRHALHDFDARIKDLEKQIADLAKDQTRLRDNLKTAPANSQYQERLLGKLNEQESRFEQLQKDLDTLHDQRNAARQALEEHLANLTVSQ